ncbi:hypothetical protein T08_2299 [Trichinella sp. T8]|nr:hypothetical protein T08_2299 [Trichinella sp. T8]
MKKLIGMHGTIHALISICNVREQLISTICDISINCSSCYRSVARPFELRTFVTASTESL